MNLGEFIHSSRHFSYKAHCEMITETETTIYQHAHIHLSVFKQLVSIIEYYETVLKCHDLKAYLMENKEGFLQQEYEKNDNC